ncbi:TldD/PmbA family protein, partial [Oscillospiraceae bacterium OttesenSCG-928-F05]|nr:TldD/PmbA family protein [Oscillospiraceae bacterium OttesenSCG-928-F05]
FCDVYTDVDDPEQKRYIDFMRAVDDYVARHCKKLVSRTLTFRGDNIEKQLVTGDGAGVHSVLPRAFVVPFFTAEGPDGRPVELFTPIGGCGGFDTVFSSPEALFPAISELYEDLMRKCEGVYPDAGEKLCVLDPELSGILAHEAVGHTTEADLVLAGSVAGPNLNGQVASPLVSMVDYAHTTPWGPAPIPLHVDDEGILCKDAVLIENGVLTGYMHNRESAAHFGVEPRGNARAFTFSDEPLIRMRNTAILPGKDSLEAMIASVDDGYYLARTSNGQADATGEFTFTVIFGYEIKNGKLARPLRDSTISGVAFEMLKTVDMVSGDMAWSCSGYCGKKQRMVVGMGGPALRCRVQIGGR